MKDKQLEALSRKASGASPSGKQKRTRFVDPTLEATKRPDDEGREREAKDLFKEMKRREF